MTYDILIYTKASKQQLEDDITEAKNCRVPAGHRDFSIAFLDPSFCHMSKQGSLYQAKLRKPTENDRFQPNFVLELKQLGRRASRSRIDDFALDLSIQPSIERLTIYDKKNNKTASVDYQVNW